MSVPPNRQSPLMCLTQDGLPWSHVEQAERLCAAGAKWIQLRIKHAPEATWLQIAARVVEICRAHHAVCIINDNVDVAIRTNADGVHLGATDEGWASARRRLPDGAILGGTINNATDAQRAVDVDCLDYVGVGPWRFTTNKKNLAPVLGAAGIKPLVAQLDGIPAWAIGGIEAADLAAVRATGAAGAAVSSALYRDGRIEDNFRALQAAWDAAANPLRS